MTRLRFRILAALATLGLAGVAVAAQPAGADENNTRHVILISVDGLHNTDLAWFVMRHPTSALAGLVKHGVSFTNAQTPFPSDSFPGMTAQVTGGNPKSTGIYYDDSFNHALLPAGTTSCAGVAPGVEVTYFEQLDKDPSALDAGQGLPGLPDSILNLTGNATSLIDPAQLPVDPATCKPVYPHQYLNVNTIFEVARAAGLRTAWSDKHAAYELLNGPSGTGVQDLFTPEINSQASVAGSDYTKDNFARSFLQHYSGTGNDISGKPKSFTSAGLQPDKIYAGAAAAAFVGVAVGDPRVPDVIGVAQYGTVYTGGKGKIAEHGGDNPQDRDVALVVSGSGVDGGRTVTSSVETTQIAPTILDLLGLNPNALKAVQIEGTKALPIG